MKTLVKMLHGSHLYGLNTPDSDKDFKGIFLSELDDLLLRRAPKHIKCSTGDDSSKNTPDDVDEEYFALGYFVELASKGETVAIDMLHANKTIESTPEWVFLVQNRSRFYTKNMRAYISYVRKQAAKYGVKGSKIDILDKVIHIISSHDEGHNLSDIREHLPVGEYSEFVFTNHNSLGKQEFYEICGRKFQLTNRLDYVVDSLHKIRDSYGARAQAAKDNNGIDWKAMSHALRAGYQIRSIFKNGTFSYPLKETDFIMKVKKGELDFSTQVQPVLDELVEEVNALSEKSDLPEKVDTEFWDEWLLSVYKKHYF